MQMKIVDMKLMTNFFEHQSDYKILTQKLEEICSLRDCNNFTEEDMQYLNLLEQVKVILTKQPLLVNRQDPYFKVTPLHTAAGAGLMKLVELMLEFNPDLNLKNCFSQTAAQRARLFARRDDIANLIETYANFGEQMNILDRQDDTPMDENDLEHDDAMNEMNSFPAP